MISRREFISLMGCSALALSLPGCSFGPRDLRGIESDPRVWQDNPLFGLATSIDDEYDYQADVEGSIPDYIQGCLYRNGPGLFERNGVRKRCILDGDGMVQAFRIEGGRVHYKNRFVQTRKFKEESSAGRYLYDTWSTRAPGGFWSRLGGRESANQAGVSILVRDGRLYAFDEFHPPYELNPESLETLGVSWLGGGEGETVFSAHSKMDHRTGEWIFYGIEFGMHPKLHLTLLGPTGRLKKHKTFPLPGNIYMHDFFVSEKHIIFNFHPVEVRPLNILLWQQSVTDAMSWNPEGGNQLFVIDRNLDNEPLQIPARATWMWHTVNAYDKGENIILDFVGYAEPDHFLGKDPALFALMEGRQGIYESPGQIQRYILTPKTKSLTQELIVEGNYEFPMIDLRHGCHDYRFGYFAQILPGQPFFTAITRVEMQSGRTQSYDFGPGHYCSEPVFAPGRGATSQDAIDSGEGHLLTEVYDSWAGRSYLAILQAENLEAGPIAIAHLRHHAPLSFHGFWYPTSGFAST